MNYHHQPRLLFHYPPRPGEDNSHFASYLKTDLTDDETTASSNEETSNSADDHSSKNGRDRSKSNGALEVDVEEAGSASPENSQGLVSMQRQPKWDDIFGYGAVNLAKLLCPAPSAHKKRFEMSLNDKAFIGWPVFSKDGHWQKRKKKRRTRPGDQVSEEKVQSGQTERINLAGKTTLQVNEDLDATSGQDTDIEGRNKTHREAGTSPEQKNTNPQSDQIQEEVYKPKKSKEEQVSKDNLKMFHVVFVLYPPPLEYHLRTKEMYDHVIKKFSRALKWEQARSNYVSKEASAISNASKGHHKTSGEIQHFKSLGVITHHARFATFGSNVSTNFVAIQSCKGNLYPVQQHIKLQNRSYSSDAYAFIVIANSNSNINIYTSEPYCSSAAWPLAHYRKFTSNR